MTNDSGESGVGKTALIKNMLRRLEMSGGTNVTDSGTVVGCVMNYADKNQILLQNIASLSEYGQPAEGNTLINSQDVTARDENNNMNWT